MKQVLITQGQVVLEDVPAPVVEPGSVLVRVAASCISIGTEMSGIRASGLPLWKRALTQPANVKKAFGMIASQGLAVATSRIGERLGAAMATGYSASGTVVAAGPGVQEFRPGDRVACAGAQYAFHAEYICVPKNLTVPVKDGVSLEQACTVTLGAIALQGVRRAMPTLGESFVVIGLGILGQLTVQLLKANGCKVIGLDPDQDRIGVAIALGMDFAVSSGSPSEAEEVRRLTAGIGADGVIITAATSSDQVVSTAFGMCRKKGRVVLVGDVGLNLNRADFYQKELDFYISASYGPGRYDEKYEAHGMDYPVGYVRWTENRNLAEYLRLVADGRIQLAPLLSAIYPLEQVGKAYASLQSGGAKPLMILLSYPSDESLKPLVRTIAVKTSPTRPAMANRLGLAVIGAGSFARGMHLPLIKAMTDRYHLRSIMSRTGHNAIAASKQFGASIATTDFESVLQDTEVDAVLIATRHNLHAEMTLQALAAGKHVLVEKPLALDRAELDRIGEFYSRASQSQPVLLTGFNRRFSPYARRIKDLVSGRSNPMLLNYRMNAGYIAPDHWVHMPEGGGRNVGEACHIYDLFTFLTGSRVAMVQAQAIGVNGGYYGATDNFVATLGFDDGSLATLTYTAMGSTDHPKEQLEVFVDGMVIVMNDFRSLHVSGSKAAGMSTKISEKGQREELVAFADALKSGGVWPIPLWEQVQATDIALQVDGYLTGQVRT